VLLAAGLFCLTGFPGFGTGIKHQEGQENCQVFDHLSGFLAAPASGIEIISFLKALSIHAFLIHFIRFVAKEKETKNMGF
jgi:hypothetical protein